MMSHLILTAQLFLNFYSVRCMDIKLFRTVECFLWHHNWILYPTEVYNITIDYEKKLVDSQNCHGGLTV